jgi:hypothetical protein
MRFGWTAELNRALIDGADVVAPFSPYVGSALVGHYLLQPRAKARPDLKPPTREIRLHKGCLHFVLCLSRVPQDASRNRQTRMAVPLKQNTKRGGIPRLVEFEKTVVTHLRAGERLVVMGREFRFQPLEDG